MAALLPDSVPWRAPDNVTIYGLGYKRGSGKDTVADMIVEAQVPETKVIRIAFADTLKEACKSLFGFSHGQVYDQEKKEQVDHRWGVTPRQALQWVGTDCIRNNLHPSFWVMAARNRIIGEIGDTEGPVCVVVTDVRFPNEVDAIHEWGGDVWNVRRQSVIDAERSAPHAPHRSETALDDWVEWEFVLENDGSLDDLRTNVVARLSAS